MFRRLDSDHLIRTAGALRRRIEERFADSGLGRVAEEHQAVTGEAAATAATIAKPDWMLRSFVIIGCLALLGVLGAVTSQLKFTHGTQGWSDTLQGLEALVNDLIFAGVAVYFLLGLETRRKRQRVLSALHTLRSLAHIVDMHRNWLPGLHCAGKSSTQKRPWLLYKPQTLAGPCAFCRLAVSYLPDGNHGRITRGISARRKKSAWWSHGGSRFRSGRTAWLAICIA